MKKKNKQLPENIHIRRDGKWEIRVSYRDREWKRKTVSELSVDRSARAIRARVAEIKKQISALCQKSVLSH